MHDGCMGSFANGKEVVDKVRMMGFSEGALPIPMSLSCQCGEEFEMAYFEDTCPHCGMVYGVTPCHSHDPNAVQPAGFDY